MTIVLAGDSIFANAAYVGQGEAVIDLLEDALTEEVFLMAVDGDTTVDIPNQLTRYPENTSHVFISCGGNDALNAVKILNEKVASVHVALTLLHTMIKEFRVNYSKMLDDLLKYNNNLVVCTIYNKSPSVFEEATTALALFNEVILEEAISRKLPIIDLRIVFSDADDYSSISPIEPSFKGGQKLSQCIKHVLAVHDFNKLESIVYS